MSGNAKNKFAAGEQALGYIYQLRYALFSLLGLPETDGIYIEMHDDFHSVDASGATKLSSLKHKAEGDKLNDLSTDFWRSVRVWLDRYKEEGLEASSARFYLVTTGEVAVGSLLASLLPGVKPDGTVVERALKALESSTSKLIVPIRQDLKELTDSAQVDFFSRITIFDASPRIEDLPALIVAEHFKGIRPKFRQYVFEHLEGWWVDQAIQLIGKKISGPLMGAESWDKLASIRDGYRDDDLPINFSGTQPPEGVDAVGDPRLFVRQLREIGVSSERIESAIIDYYRAFEQRSAWARENVLVGGEVERYEERLVEEWKRYRALILESVQKGAAEEGLASAGRDIYKWAEFGTEHIRIRKNVSEPYIVRGGFHILANQEPMPRVYWHPRFLERLGQVLEGSR